ncbi:hypothetical protein ACFU8I_02865 [Streptomyces sp. NPDC057540]|uniref:hypothetical protein n=1 Tax=Streptomyces sp. NPDC057540 TaxID=3346160 RepID=UPI0036811A9D
MPSFVIVTVDGTPYRQGEPASHVPTLAEIGATDQTLDSFVYSADYVVLHYGGYTLSIPEAHIAHIAERDRA